MELKRICDTITYWENTGAQELHQTAQTDVIVPDTYPDVVQLYENSAIVFIESKRAMAGRIEVEGRVRCEILYTAAEEELVRLETSLGFTAEAEDDMVMQEDMVLVTATVERMDVRIINSRKLSISAELLVHTCAYRETTKEICTDVEEAGAYGIQRLRETNRVEMVEAVREKGFTISDRFEIERTKSGAEEILRANVSLAEQDHKVVGRKIILKGALTIDCLYRTFEGQIDNASFELPFSQILETEGNEDAKCDLSFFFRGLSFQPEQESYYEGRSLALKAEITVQAVCSSTEELDRLEDIYSISYPMQVEYDKLLFGQTQINALRSASINEEGKKDKSKMPALVLRMTDAGEALWDLARQYDTTVEAIASANSLAGARTLKRGMLLIPVMGQEGEMEEELYGNIAKRTGGNIYVGVVGPVRTGKSTLIKRFMESLVIPNIEDVYRRERAKDELPQSGSGKTIMTAEPKFVPEEAVEVSFPGGGRAMVRMIDSVGYMVDGAIGTQEDGRPRMVTTPWFDHEITMEEAAREGTNRIISDHSTIGLLVTTDGSITDLPRQAYVAAEEKTQEVLKKSGIPYVIVLNSQNPLSEQCMALKAQLEKKYGAAVFPCNCQSATAQEINDLLGKVLYEFPVTEINIWMPSWMKALPENSPVRARLMALVLDKVGQVKKLSDVQGAIGAIGDSEDVESVELMQVDAGTGAAKARINLPRSMFYNTLSEETGLTIRDDGDLVSLLTSLADVKHKYDRISSALDEVRATGYGIVMPDADEMKLEEPEIIRQGGRYGVKLRASAPSIHMMLTDIKTEVSPIVGDEKQSEELLNYIMQEFDGDRSKLWESNIFGKSLHDLVNEGLTAKLRRLPVDARGKFQGTLEKVINDGSGTLICIML